MSDKHDLERARGMVKSFTGMRDTDNTVYRALVAYVMLLEATQRKQHLFDAPCHSHQRDCEGCAARKKLEDLLGGRLV